MILFKTPNPQDSDFELNSKPNKDPINVMEVTFCLPVLTKILLIYTHFYTMPDCLGILVCFPHSWVVLMGLVGLEEACGTTVYVRIRCMSAEHRNDKDTLWYWVRDDAYTG